MKNLAAARKVIEQQGEEISRLKLIVDNTTKKLENGALVIDEESLRGLIGKDNADKLAKRMRAEAARKTVKPEGFRSVVSSTWEAGWMGKTQVVLAGIGAVTSLAFLLEGIGAVTGWDTIRVITKFSSLF